VTKGEGRVGKQKDRGARRKPEMGNEVGKKKKEKKREGEGESEEEEVEGTSGRRGGFYTGRGRATGVRAARCRIRRGAKPGRCDSNFSITHIHMHAYSFQPNDSMHFNCR
jgi:hypothetical protein